MTEVKKERSGNYQLVKICINEIEALKRLGFSREVILNHLIEYFGTTMSLRQLSSNVGRVQEELGKEVEEQVKLRSEQILNLVKTPEQINRNFEIYQKIISTNSRTQAPKPIVDRRAPQPKASAQNPAAHSSPPKSKTPELKPNPSLEKPSIQAAAPSLVEEDDERVEKLWGALLAHYEKTNVQIKEAEIPKIKQLLSDKLDDLEGLEGYAIADVLTQFRN